MTNQRVLKIFTFLFMQLNLVSVLAAGFSTVSTNDTTPPIISDLQITNIKHNKAIVTWNTDEIADSHVSFSLNGNSEVRVIGSIQYKKNHTLVLSKLSPSLLYDVTVKSTDLSGNSSTATINFSTTQYVNSAPSISGTPSGQVVANSSYIFLPVNSDAENDPLTFSIINKPSWAEFNVTTGELSGIPSLLDIAEYTGITISVSDGNNVTSLPAFSITVSNNSLTTNQDGTKSYNLVYSDSNSNNYTNSINNFPNVATITSLSGSKIFENNVSSIKQKIIMNNSGSIEAAVEVPDGFGNPQVAKITSSFKSSSLEMLTSGAIKLSTDSVTAELKENGSSSLCRVLSNSIQTCLTLQIPNSSISIDSQGLISINVTYELSGVQNTIVVTIPQTGVVRTELSQKDQNNNVILYKTFSSESQIGAGSSITISKEKILITEIRDNRISF